MTANQFRLFLASVIVVGVVGFFGWQAMERSGRIRDCVERYSFGSRPDSYFREQCEAAERSGHLKK